MLGKRRSLGLIAVASCVLLAGPGRSEARQEAPRPSDRDEAIRLCRAHREIEALPLLEKLYKADPMDREVKERLACALAGMASLYDEAEQAPALLRARKMFIELKATEPLSDLGEVLLSMIPEDGKLRPDATRKDVADAMKQGEAAFARRDFSVARTFYEKALVLDPKLYRAALFAGDTWFAQGKMDEAIAWFAKAAKLDPNQTGAFRYWGDALMKKGQPLEARERFFMAIVAEPYSRPPWVSLGQWAKAVGAAPSHPRVMPPDPKPGEPRTVSLDDGTLHLGVYDATREAWKDAIFREKHPEETTYRHSLDEESWRLHALARAVRADVKSGSIKTLDPGLANLLKLDDEGLIEAYILLARPDEGIAKDYVAYREKNREKLFDYLARHVAPMPDKSGK